jgi:hypothetical protein
LFSTSVRVDEGIEIKKLKKLGDIYRNGYNFSDGCGYLSQELASFIS